MDTFPLLHQFVLDNLGPIEAGNISGCCWIKAFAVRFISFNVKYLLHLFEYRLHLFRCVHAALNSANWKASPLGGSVARSTGNSEIAEFIIIIIIIVLLHRVLHVE